MNNDKIAEKINVLEAAAILFILGFALYIEFFLQQEPCVFCLLQRWGLLGVVFGFLLNAKYNAHPAHYAISLISAIFTTLVSGRQILMHIVPGSGTYGNPLFGLHLYTWVFIISLLIIIGIAIMLIFESQFQLKRLGNHSWFTTAVQVVFIFTIAVCLMNAIAAFLNCRLLGC